MFTGRVAEIGHVQEIDGADVRVRAPKAAQTLRPGGAVCLDGVRLTVRAVDDGVITVTVSQETRHRSTFDAVGAGARVNVEVPLAVGDPLDGHLVQGYVDAVGKVVRVDDEDGCARVWIRPPARLLETLVGKSPIAVDGVSVTVAEVQRDRFSVVLLPQTRALTTLDAVPTGRRVNLELDGLVRLATRRAVAAGRVLANLPWAGAVHGRSGVEKVVRQIAAGGAAVVWDPTTEGEADVVVAANRLSADTMRFLVREVCGMPCVPCAPEVLDRLELAPLPGTGDRHGTAWCTPVDLASLPGTGVSAPDRAATIRRLADTDATAADFLSPGHVHPLRARPGLLGERPGHTEATVALCAAAGLAPVGVCCEIMSADGTMAGAAEAEVLALAWGLPMIDIADLRELL